MPYKRKLLIYAAAWWIAGGVIGYRWLQDSNFSIVFGVALLMAVTAMKVCSGMLLPRNSNGYTQAMRVTVNAEAPRVSKIEN